MNEFTGPDLVRYEISPCKRCFGCQRMEQENFIPPKKCNQAVMMAENEQMRMDEIRTKEIGNSGKPMPEAVSDTGSVDCEGGQNARSKLL